MQRHVFATTDALAAELVRLSLLAADDAVRARGRFDVALTGGSAASTLYPVLAQAALPWDKVHVWFGDERCVPPSHDDSNFKLAKDCFLGRVGIPEANVHRVKGELPPAEAAAAYQRELLDMGGVLDVVHLGMGPDGHICSLFPGHRLLAVTDELVASLEDSPKPPPARVTFTMPALQKARALWFLVAGGGKAEAVRAALTDPTSNEPAAIATRAHKNATWLLDGAAAGLIKSG